MDQLLRDDASEVMRHMLSGDNLGLNFMRQVALDGDYSHFGVSTTIIDNRTFYSSKGIVYLAPLYTYPPERGLEASDGREPNLSPTFTVELERRLALCFISEGKGDLSRKLSGRRMYFTTSTPYSTRPRTENAMTSSCAPTSRASLLPTM